MLNIEKCYRLNGKLPVENNEGGETISNNPAWLSHRREMEVFIRVAIKDTCPSLMRSVQSMNDISYYQVVANILS